MDGPAYNRRVRRTKSLDILLEQLPKNLRLASNPRFLTQNGPKGGGVDAGAQAATGDQQKDESFEETIEGFILVDAQHLILHDNHRGGGKLVSMRYGNPEGLSGQSQAVPHQTAEASFGRMQWLADAVDKILLQRTQMRHQLATLCSSRAYLESSLQDLFAKIDSLKLSDTGPAETPLSGADAAASAGRSSGSDAHHGVFQYQLPWSPAEQEEQRASEKPPLSLPETLQQTREDFQRVRQQETMFSTALDTLSNSEYRLNEKQKALWRDLNDPLKTAEIKEEMLTAGPEQSVARPGTRSATELPTIVEEYFDRRGDIGVWMERQQELDEAYAEGKAEREFIADRGDPLDVTNEEFDKQFQDRREHIERELEIAQKEADELERRCQAEGHDLAAYRTTRRSDTASVMSPSERPTTSYSPVLQAVRELDVNPVELQPPARQAGVSTWLRGIDWEDMERADATIPSVPETPVQEQQSDDAPVLSSPTEDLSAAISEAMGPDPSDQDLEKLTLSDEQPPPSSGRPDPHKEIASSGRPNSREEITVFVTSDDPDKEPKEIGPDGLPHLSLTSPSPPGASPAKPSPGIHSPGSVQASIDTSESPPRRLSTPEHGSSADYQPSTASTDQTSVAPSLRSSGIGSDSCERAGPDE